MSRVKIVAVTAGSVQVALAMLGGPPPTSIPTSPTPSPTASPSPSPSVNPQSLSPSPSPSTSAPLSSALQGGGAQSNDTQANDSDAVLAQTFVETAQLTQRVLLATRNMTQFQSAIGGYSVEALKLEVSVCVCACACASVAPSHELLALLHRR